MNIEHIQNTIIDIQKEALLEMIEKQGSKPRFLAQIL
eukprot:UN25236